MSQYIMALDQGTSSSRAIIFNQKSEICMVAQKEFNQIYPKAGWVEHNPMEIWETQTQVAKEAMRKMGISHHNIAAIGITNQRETTLIWEKETGKPIMNAIVWQDRRTASLCDEIKQRGLEEIIIQKSGLVVDAYFSATKIAWILDHIEGARERANRGELLFGTIDTFLIWHLSGQKAFVTDVTNASRTLLFNIHTQSFDDELLAIFDIPKSMLPEVVQSCGIVAHTQEFGGRIPISGVIGDQQAATFGNACMQKGMIKNTYGTGCFTVMNTQKLITSTHQLLCIPTWSIDDKVNYGLEGSVFMGGATVQWLRDNLGLIQQASDIEHLAKTVKSSDGVYLVPAFVGLGAPHWDQYATGLLIGMSRSTNRGHIAKAVLESIAFQVADLITAMRQDSQVEISMLRADGGACVNDLLMQFQANILGIAVQRPKCLETTALGSAYLAGMAVGYWRDIAQIEQMWASDKVFEPTLSEDEREMRLSEWHRALQRATAWHTP